MRYVSEDRLKQIAAMNMGLDQELGTAAPLTYCVAMIALTG